MSSEDLIRTIRRFTQRIVPNYRLVFCGAALATIGLFVKLWTELREGELTSFDVAVHEYFLQDRTESRTTVFLEITALGSTAMIAASTAFIAFFLGLRRRWDASIQIVFAVCGAALSSTILKRAIDRDRPPEANWLVHVSNQSFPSGHTVVSTAFYSILALIAFREVDAPGAKWLIGVSTLALATLIGISRLYLGVHYPTDIFSGFFLGISWSLIVVGTIGRKRNLFAP